jgi:tRNA (guanine37-N1)-methyltransferase
MTKRFDILSLFPEALREYLQSSLMGKAAERGLVEFGIHQLRDWATDKHRTVDDQTFGGGEGMVMKPEPTVAAIEELSANYQKGRVIYLSPQGRKLTQEVAVELSNYDEILLLCGRYEGVDERVLTGWVHEEISLGDFILCGGEIPALALAEAITRLIPGVVGKERSLAEETFMEGLVEYPHYTRPREFRGQSVPEILLQGNHREISRWRRQESLRRTFLKRPDLLAGAQLSEEDEKFLASLKQEYDS